MIALELEKYIDTKHLDKLGELFILVNEPRFFVKDTGIKYRVINHWDEKGLIKYFRANELDNRKFSFINFIWIKVVDELRSMGISIDILKNITNEIYTCIPIETILEIQAENLESLKKLNYEDKDELIEFLKSGEYKQVKNNEQNINFNLLQLLITEAINSRNSVSIIVYKDGSWLPFVKQNEHLYDAELIHKMEFSSNIRVNLTEIIFNFLAEDYFGVYTTELKLFTPIEKYLLSLSRQGKYKKIIAEVKSKVVEINKSKKSHQKLIEFFKTNKCKKFYVVDENDKKFVLNEKILKEGFKKIQKENHFDFESLTKFQFDNLI